MSIGTFDSPQDAAMAGFPAKYCRVVASRVEGEDAYVLLDTGSDGRPYLYGVNCSKRDGGWLEGGSGNGPSWSQAGPDDLLGTLVIWGDAPAEAEMVRAWFDGGAIEEPVNNGVYLAVWWRTRCPEESWPRVEAFRIGDVWIRTAG
jgi:hypothetical protein